MSSRIALLASGVLLAVGLGALCVYQAGPQVVAGDGMAAGARGPFPSQPLVQEPPESDGYCLTCHADQSLTTGLAGGEILPLYVDARALRDSAHKFLSCVSCHEANRVCPPDRAGPLDMTTYRAMAKDTCKSCHQAASRGYEKSAHWKPGPDENEGASCIACHSPGGSGHSVRAMGVEDPALSAVLVTGMCGRCHQRALETYNRTSHGKVARLGDITSTAVCTTCHGDHRVAKAEVLVEANALDGLASLCSSCHARAGAAFARAWPGHSGDGPGIGVAGIAERVSFYGLLGAVIFGLVYASVDSIRRLRARARGQGGRGQT